MSAQLLNSKLYATVADILDNVATVEWFSDLIDQGEGVNMRLAQLNRYSVESVVDFLGDFDPTKYRVMKSAMEYDFANGTLLTVHIAYNECDRGIFLKQVDKMATKDGTVTYPSRQKYHSAEHEKLVQKVLADSIIILTKQS